MPADAFYEWKKLDAKSRQPYAFSMRDNEPFAFAGLWDAWKAPDGAWLLSFSIITTEANELMAEVHKRMPVILRTRDYDRWLQSDADRLPIDLLKPFDSDLMTASPCNLSSETLRTTAPKC